MTLDQFDRKILATLQADATLSVSAVAERVGLSPTPCWRRIQRLEKDGYIRKRVALLDRRKVNAGIVVFIAIRTNRHHADWLKAFHEAIAGMPEVVEFYRLSGDIDYLIRAMVPDIEAYDELYRRLIEKVELFDVSSMFAMEEIKYTTEVPLTYVDQR